MTEPQDPPETLDPLEAKLQALPVAPGCYVFRDAKGEVLYVGKAKSLRARVRSYFQSGSSDTRSFIPFLKLEVGDLETIVTATEKEAAILENNLIKERKPRYNVKLRDDKEYLSLRISTEHPWPRLELVRRPTPDGARYFGPYHSATAARRTLNVVEKHFKLRTCTDRELESRRRPCLEYQIKRCPAPCVYEVDRDIYSGQVRAVGLFLDGRHDELTAELESRMRKAAEAFEYELAATYRDQLHAVESVRQAQRVVAVSDRDQDVLGIYREGDLLELALMIVRSGRVIDVGHFSNKRVEVPDDEVVANFVREHYGEGGGGESVIPDEILVPVLPEGAEGVMEWLAERRQLLARGRGERARRVEVLAPARGPKKGLLDLARQNAEHAFKEKRRTEDDILERLAKVQLRLRLPTLPRRIECIDISHLGGLDTVGAIVVLENGLPDKRSYKTYNVRGVAEGDDYAAMYQVLSRRFRRGREARAAAEAIASEAVGSGVAASEAVASEAMRSGVAAAEAAASEEAEPVLEEPARSEPIAPEAELAVDEWGVVIEEGDEPPRRRSETPGSNWELPDLLVVDGGRGQLQVALTAAHDLGLHDLAIVGLAKERETPHGAEKLVDRVYLPGQKNPISLRPNSPELFFLARARDEAHRFSNRGRKRVGRRRRFSSELESLPGIGPKTRAALLKRFGSLDAIRTATDEELLATPQVTRRQVTALRQLSLAVDPEPTSDEDPPVEPVADSVRTEP